MDDEEFLLPLAGYETGYIIDTERPQVALRIDLVDGRSFAMSMPSDVARRLGKSLISDASAAEGNR